MGDTGCWERNIMIRFRVISVQHSVGYRRDRGSNDEDEGV
jgi:hypothetical protein